MRVRVYESAEDYLEAILVVGKRCGMVRSIDIANELGFSKPSVSVAMKKLRESGYIVMAISSCCPQGRQLRSKFMSGIRR